MLTKNLTPFLVGVVPTSRRPPQPEMTVVVRGVYALTPHAPFAPLEGMARGPLSGEVFTEDDRTGECLRPSDFADYKLRGELIALATCHAPGKKPVTECPVRFTLGGLSKTLRVVGSRRVRPVVGASDPEPFTSMPLRWSNAWGGPDYADNPVGRGVGIDLLPTVEHPGDSSRSADAREPAGVGPIHPDWPIRKKKLGKAYGGDYKKTRAPYYAADFDWSHFQSAPLDQQIEGYFKGDESFSFTNIHPDAHELSGKLPAVRVRVFTKDTRGRFREIAMVLDTIVVNGDEEKLELVWRGLGEVAEADFTDVAFMLVASEPLAERPLVPAHYQLLLDEFEADPTGLKAKLPEGMLEAGERLKKLHAGEPLPPPKPGLDPVSAMLDQQLGDFAKKEQAEVRSSIASARAKLDDKPEKQAELDAKLAQAAADATENAIPTMRMLQLGALPPQRLRRPMRVILEQVANVEARLEGRDVPPEQRAQLDALRAVPHRPDWKKLDPSYEPPTGPLPMNEPGPGADLRERDLQGVDWSGRDLSNANLEEADLTGANLRGANLRGAKLRAAVLVRADLTKADLAGADLTVVNAAHARAIGVNLRGAKLDQTFLAGAVLEGAVLEGVDGQWVVFEKANLREVSAAGAKLPRSDFSEADLTSAKLEGVDATASLFAGAKLDGTDCARAALDGASFAKARLPSASFARARLDKTFFSDAKLAKADFTRASMKGAHFTNADASSARFFAADLRDARFDRASLRGASFARANLFHANLRDAALDNATFQRASLYGANLLGASGTGVDFLDANLKTATLEEK